MQHCLDETVSDNDINANGFSIINLIEDDRHIDEIINEILNQADLFDLSKGCVIRCHILRQYRSNNHPASQNDDLLTNDDLILFSIHHSVFDEASTSIFIRDFTLAYENNSLLSMDDNTLQYIDYSVHERLFDMTLSREFWHTQLQGCNLEYPLSLPIDRQRDSTNLRSGLASTAEIIFDDETSLLFLNYASLHNLTPFQLGLATFYVFLFKLTHGETDLCIASINANRYRNELENIIGMFVATLPYCIQLDSCWSFDELVKHVREKCLSILEHSHYPLQQILADFHLNQSNASFLETMFDFITVSSNVNHFCIDDVCLEEVCIGESYDVAKFDFSMTFIYNPTSDVDKLSYSFICCHDLFEERTVVQIARRFQYLFEQLFRTKSTDVRTDPIITSINKLSLILSEETQEIQTIKFCRVDDIIDEGM